MSTKRPLPGEARPPGRRASRTEIGLLAAMALVALWLAWPDRWADVACSAMFFLFGFWFAIADSSVIQVDLERYTRMHNTLSTHGLCDCSGCTDAAEQAGKEAGR